MQDHYDVRMSFNDHGLWTHGMMPEITYELGATVHNLEAEAELAAVIAREMVEEIDREILTDLAYAANAEPRRRLRAYWSVEAQQDFEAFSGRGDDHARAAFFAEAEINGWWLPEGVETKSQRRDNDRSFYRHGL